MSLRKVTRAVAATAASAALAGGFSVLAFAGSAGATGTNGSIIPQGSFTAGTPFDSGQLVDVSIPANSTLTPGASVFVLECAAPNGVLPTTINACDGNTGYGGGTITVESNGAVDVINDSPLNTPYTIYALPDSPKLHESPTHKPVCGLGTANECVLYVGQGGGSDTGLSQPFFFTPPFQVASDATDSGTINPGDGTPEVPLAVGLPIAAMGVIGGTLFFRRRRAGASA